MAITSFTKAGWSTLAIATGSGCQGGAKILSPFGSMSIVCRSQSLIGAGLLVYGGAPGGIPTFQLSAGGSTSIALDRGEEGLSITRDGATIAVGFCLAWQGGPVPPVPASWRIVSASFFN